MASKESTAVNALIDLARAPQRPLDDDDLLFDAAPKAPTNPFAASADPFAPAPAKITAPKDLPAPMARHRVPSASRIELNPAPPVLPSAPVLPPTPAPTLFGTGLPPVRPSSPAISVPTLPAAPAATSATQLPVLPTWQDDDLEHTNQVMTKLVADDLLDDDDLIEDHTGVNRTEVTMKTRAPQSPLALAKKYALPLSIVGVLGVLAAGYVYFDGEGKHGPSSHPATAEAKGVLPTDGDKKDDDEDAKPAAAALDTTTPAKPAAVEAVAPAPTTTTETAAPNPSAVEAVAPAAAAAPAADAEISLTFDTKPSGATVMLVDRGQSLVIGTTPIARPVQADHDYDAVFTYNGLPTKVVHFHAGDVKTISVDLDGGTAAVEHVAAPKPAAETHTEATVAAVATTPAPAKHETAKPSPKKASTTVTASKKPAAATKATTTEHALDKHAAAATPAKADGHNGTLMINAKPPCEIYVDGKRTGLTTPQRSLSVPPGDHTITLVNTQNKIKKSVAVKVAAGKSTKVIEDYTSMIKK